MFCVWAWVFSLDLGLNNNKTKKDKLFLYSRDLLCTMCNAYTVHESKFEREWRRI